MAENAALHDQLVVQAREAGVSEERQRLAREIHDTIAQGLAGVVAQLEAATQGPPTEQARHLDLARSLARESLGEARRSVEALQPGALEGARLPEALAAYAKRWSQLHGVEARVETIGQPVPLATETEVTLYRVAQEALTNVGRHSGAQTALVTVSYGDDGVALDVGDDGHGFAADEVPGPPGVRRGGGHRPGRVRAHHDAAAGRRGRRAHPGRLVGGGDRRPRRGPARGLGERGQGVR